MCIEGIEMMILRCLFRAIELAREGCLVFEFSGDWCEAVVGEMSVDVLCKLREYLSYRGDVH